MRTTILLVVLALAGCGVPQELSKQADEVHSIAAEGALLAHEASEGSPDAFTTEHARALRGRLEQLRPAIDERELAQVAAKVDAMLTALADEPASKHGAATIERALDDAAATAEELAR